MIRQAPSITYRSLDMIDTVKLDSVFNSIFQKILDEQTSKLLEDN